MKKGEVKDFINLGIVVNNQGKALMIRRREEEAGKDGSVLRWAFPGGKQFLEETREQCVEREVLFETGYKVKSTRQISLRMHPQFKVLVVYHLCKLLSQRPTAKPKEPHEVSQIKWVEPKEIKSLITTDLDQAVARELKIN